MKFLNDLLGFAVLTGPLPVSAKLNQSIYQGACMKRNVLCAILMAFLVFSPLGSGETLADDQSTNTAQMQATIKAQVAEIAQLKKERDGLKLNVEEAKANMYQLGKENAELKTIITRLQKELASAKEQISGKNIK